MTPHANGFLALELRRHCTNAGGAIQSRCPYAGGQDGAEVTATIAAASPDEVNADSSRPFETSPSEPFPSQANRCLRSGKAMSEVVKSVSPDGRFQVRILAWEVRKSVRIETPEISVVASGKTLLKFSSNMWSLDRELWQTNERVQLVLRQYPGNHFPKQLFATVDCVNKTAELDSRPPVPLDELEALLERQLTWG